MDLSKFDIFVYSTSGIANHRTMEIRSKIPDDHWRIGKPEQIAEMLRRDRIDIAVDLGGHAACENLPIFALTPSPIQVTWIGYANTTGLKCFDYRITDHVADPIGTKQ